eukprot:g38580.t1
MCESMRKADSIRKDASLGVVTIPGSGGLQVKASLYMDGVAIICSDPLSVSRHMSICDQFELASGAKVRLPEDAGNMVRRGWGVHKNLGKEHITKLKQKLGICEHDSLSIASKNLII